MNAINEAVMKACPNCGYENRYGVLFCEECAEPLHSVNQLTARLDAKDVYSLEDTPQGLRLLIHPQRFYDRRAGFSRGHVVIGRSRKAAELAITKFDSLSLEMLGVSRSHAALIPLKDGVGLQDLGSTNGTRLNGYRLAAGHLYHLVDADCIELGKLPVQVRIMR